jgi:hypothetical protein
MRDVQMPTQRLGATPLVVSRLGLGLAALGRPPYITLGRERDFGVDRSVANLERRCHEMLDAAYAAGPSLRRCRAIVLDGRELPWDVVENAQRIERSDNNQVEVGLYVRGILAARCPGGHLRPHCKTSSPPTPRGAQPD